MDFHQKLRWKDIQICKYENNRPYIQLWHKGKPTQQMKLSISHDGDYVAAFVACVAKYGLKKQVRTGSIILEAHEV
ncbi:hypothetical protein PCK2_000191 [Pneumocystis canis]|nr:hypothetical protein PCK2_000191 [Pneumocystis canis]